MEASERPFDPKKLPSRSHQVPDLKDAVEGWRAWRVAKALPKFGVAPKLYSATHGDYYWTPRKAAEAECAHCSTHVITLPDGTVTNDVPGEFCSCGFYSAKDREHLMSMSYHRYDGDGEFGQFTVIGQVANWGKVVEGSQGWRSQFSYPKFIYVPYEAHHLAKPISVAYGVPVKLENFLQPGYAEV
jgi:hypothetical protein